ncbi:TrmH family RNA methyltransferase [Fuchsiella alkaliacetigena]|uniref:TrmH family RNA methyltransferase n=1 Tax=Fuchsiella alkaliacetigena TaxID=957042 RepID=UPI00200A3A33|nr:RNA methyltransferase [Fuchsiella alkaliacetigena]MCK8825053.1 RNA methyltransferase [Fuchsiella alkaliacetigena]
MSEIISSLHNSKIKFLRSLYKKKYRREHQKFILEGSRIISDALAAEAEIHQVFYSADFLTDQQSQELIEDLKAEAEVIEITDSLLAELADTETPQGIIAIVDQPQFEISDFLAEENDFYLVVDRVQDPGNLGTIIRTADGAGVDGVFLLKGTVDIYNLKTIRATMGALFRVPIFNLEGPAELEELLLKEELQIVVGDLGAEDYYYQLDYTQPTAVVVGNEGAGPQPETLALADSKVKIPLTEGAESLNVAIATGVMLYEIVRQRA